MSSDTAVLPLDDIIDFKIWFTAIATDGILYGVSNLSFDFFF